MAIFVAALLLRTVALSSDAYTHLDWSAALLTDEGFYIHNARNVALFGHARTDDFNNMLLAPVLHTIQVGVFEMFGVGAVQARSISVVCSLLALWLLWSALRRAFDERIALTGVLFLALDHTYLLYNRLALLDTPAALGAVGAFHAFVRGCQPPPAGTRPLVRDARVYWLFLSGLLLGMTITNRMLAAYLLPCPFVALWTARHARRGAAAAAAGLALIAVTYLAGWYWPHRAEIAPMNDYYRASQIQPRSVGHLLENVQHAFVGDFRGISPYLFRHTPIVYLLALGAVGGILLRGLAGRVECRDTEATTPDDRITRRAALRYLAAWFVIGWVMLATISYSPSRYYVTLYPAMASLAAMALWRIAGWLRDAREPGPGARVAFAAVAGFALFHLALAVVHFRGVFPRVTSLAILYTVTLAAVMIVLLGWKAGCARVRPHAGRIAPIVMVAWLAFNAGWLADWAHSIGYTQIEMSRWLGANLPAGSVLIGDVAPGLTMDNRFEAIHVQPHLANDHRPVERFSGGPRFIAILDGRWKERYWTLSYPEMLEPERRVRLAHVLRWDVGVYAVDLPKRIP